MKKSQVYLKAAEQVFYDNDVCCIAIADVVGQGWGLAYIKKFAELFKPKDCYEDGRWFEDKRFLNPNNGMQDDYVPFPLKKEYQEHRIMSLLLMAEIAKDEENEILN